MRGSRLRVVAASVAVAGVVGALAGCAVRPTTEETGLVVTPKVTTTSAVATPTVSLPAPSPLPSGSQWITTAAHGVKFAVPSSWAMFDLTKFSDPAVKAALAPIAERLGETVDQYVAGLMSNDLIVAGPQANGFAPSISVPKEEAQTAGDPPSKDAAQNDLAGLKATVTDVSPVTTSLGEGYVVAFTRPGDAAGQTLYSAHLTLPTIKNTVFLLTVEADTAAARDALVAGVVASVQKA